MSFDCIDFPNPEYGQRLRKETWVNLAEQWRNLCRGKLLTVFYRLAYKVGSSCYAA